MKTPIDPSVCFKCTVIDDQHPNGVPLEQWGNQAPIQEPAEKIKGVDEYGPMLAWFKHWINFPVGTKLYTTPPAQRQWVELTGEEISEIAMQSGAYDEQLLAFARAIEAKSKEKNT